MKLLPRKHQTELSTYQRHSLPLRGKAKGTTWRRRHVRSHGLLRHRHHHHSITDQPSTSAGTARSVLWGSARCCRVSIISCEVGHPENPLLKRPHTDMYMYVRTREVQYVAPLSGLRASSDVRPRYRSWGPDRLRLSVCRNEQSSYITGSAGLTAGARGWLYPY
jgi:hypothetical protein